MRTVEIWIIRHQLIQQNESIVPDFNKPEKNQYSADTGDIITNLKPEAEAMAPTKYVAVKMKKSDLTVNNGAAATSSNKSSDKVCGYFIL